MAAPRSQVSTTLTRLIAGVVALGATSGCFDAFGTFQSGVDPGVTAGGGSDVDLTGSSVTGGGGSTPEDCGNGVDDDSDELTDCEDVGDCGGYMCLPLPAGVAGWEGPTLLSRTDAPLICEGAYPVAGPSGKLLADKCKCICADAAEQTCGAAFTAFTDGACGIVAGQAALPGTGACTAIVGSPTASSYTAIASPGGGSCAASVTGGPGSTDPTRATCSGARGGGCESGTYCGRPPSPAAARVCFTHEGDVPCPDSVYRERELLYAEVGPAPACDDAPCVCGGPAGGACTGGGLGYGSSCSTVVGAPTSACVSIAPEVLSSAGYAAGTVSTAGKCAAGPNPLVGSLPPSVTTVCCADGF